MTDSPLSHHPDEEELAWIGSLLALGAFIGSYNIIVIDISLRNERLIL